MDFLTVSMSQESSIVKVGPLPRVSQGFNQGVDQGPLSANKGCSHIPATQASPNTAPYLFQGWQE